MENRVQIYREIYSNLPERFVKKIEHDLRYIQEKELPGLRKIYLFGSAARGEVRSTSDIDLLIVTKCGAKGGTKDRMLFSEVRWTLDEPVDGVSTDVVFQSEDTERADSVFGRELDRDKKLILEVEE